MYGGKTTCFSVFSCDPKNTNLRVKKYLKKEEERFPNNC